MMLVGIYLVVKLWDTAIRTLCLPFNIFFVDTIVMNRLAIISL